MPREYYPAELSRDVSKRVREIVFGLQASRPKYSEPRNARNIHALSFETTGAMIIHHDYDAYTGGTID